MSGKFRVPIELVDETNENNVTVFASDAHLAIGTGGEEHIILDDRTVLGTLASQNADSVAITGGTISGISPIAVADGGTGADSTEEALENLGAVPTTRTINGNALSSNIVLSSSDIGSEPAIAVGTTSQFWRGDKAWSDFEDSVRATLLTGLSTDTKTAILATDTIIVALGKLQAQITSSGFQNPMTEPYDIIFSKDDSGTPERLPIGEPNTFLQAKVSPSGTPDIGYETSPVTFQKNVTGAAYGNGYYVFCGQDTIGYTSDITAGITATYRFPWTSFFRLRFLNGHFIATASDGKIFFTDDPTDIANWTSVKTGATGDIIDVVFFKNYYVCTSDSEGILYSSNLTSWTKKDVAIASLTGIACNDDYIGVVNGTSFSYCTTVSGSWTVVADIGIRLSGLVAGNGYWCAVDTTATSTTSSTITLAIKYSSTMTSWVTKDTYVNSNPGYGIDFSNGYFVFTRSNFYSGSTSYITYYTADPSGSWTQKLFPKFSPGGVTYANGYYIFFGDVRTATYFTIYQVPPYYDTSLDTAQASSLPIGGFQCPEALRGVVRHKTSSRDDWTFVGDHISGNTDSITTTQGNSTYSSYSFLDVCLGGYDSSGNQYLVACGKNGVVVRSTTASLSTSSRISSGTTDTLNSIAYGKNTYVVVGNGGP
jgi:hypothetical protein